MNAMEIQNPQPQVCKEYVVKIPKDRNKRFNVMRFNRSLNVDVEKWAQAKMERENNYKEFKLEEDGPKYGAGSEFGREQRDEARRKKHGIITKKYNPEDQPWILKVNGKGGKKFKGVREGGVTENISYYVFTQAADGTFEAYPVREWYNFTPIQCYKTLSPEEAEEAYGRREKVFNYFSIMTQKRMRGEAVEDEEGEEKKSGKAKKKHKEFKITDFDELGLVDSDDSESDNEDEEKPKKKKEKKKKNPKNKKKKDEEEKSEDEALEESDEGDFDDKEVDYITNSSSSEEDVEEEEKTNRDLKGVEDEEALRKLMSDDEEEEENPEENKETNENGETKEKTAEAKPKVKPKKSDSSADSSSESSDSDFDDPKFTSAIFVPKSKKKNGSDNSAGSSRANTPTKLQGDKDGQKSLKRKFDSSSPSSSTSKKQKMDSQSGHSSSSSLDGINEETVRRYLKRKPMTAVELLHKFKSKKTKMSSQQLVQKIADVLKKMDLQKSNIKGRMYLSVKNP